jgi:hypothetical protein
MGAPQNPVFVKARDDPSHKQESEKVRFIAADAA